MHVVTGGPTRWRMDVRQRMLGRCGESGWRSDGARGGGARRQVRSIGGGGRGGVQAGPGFLSRDEDRRRWRCRQGADPDPACTSAADPQPLSGRGGVRLKCRALRPRTWADAAHWAAAVPRVENSRERKPGWGGTGGQRSEDLRRGGLLLHGWETRGLL